MDEKKNNTAETPAFKAPENAPVRRVGTLTLGVCLIVCGVLFLCYFFVPHFNWELALKIAPAAGLILLFWIEYDARQERDLTDEESDRLRLDLDEGTGPDLDEENEDSSAASHTEV